MFELIEMRLVINPYLLAIMKMKCKHKKCYPLLISIFIGLSVLISYKVYTQQTRTTNIIPYINDGSASWENINLIRIYKNTNSPEPWPEYDITSKKTIDKIVQAVCDSNSYRRADKYELVYTWIIAFDNGVFIGIDDKDNYGYISDTFQISGGPNYYIPEKLLNTVKKLALTGRGSTD